MRALTIPAVTAIFLASHALAFAAENVTGTIKSLDLSAHTVTLDNGTVYTLPSDFKDPGLKTGQKVSISWEMMDGKHMVDSVMISKS